MCKHAVMTLHRLLTSYYLTMRCHATTRYTAAACALFSAALLCAQTQRAHRQKPSTPGATAPAPQPTLQPVVPAPPPTPAELPAQPASVTYANGQLTVAAHNSSLNQILRDISRQTSMKITGGVADERVFGNYGPEPTAQVLNSLLDGTGSNMLLVGADGPAPSELILTPRNGGATPPGPTAFASSMSSQAEEPPSKQPYNSRIPANPPETTPQPPAPSNPASDQQQSPNGVKTPQDIFNQLMKLRQQQTQPHTNQQ